MTGFLLGRNYTLTKYSDFLRRHLLKATDETTDHHSFCRELVTQTCQKHLKRRYQDKDTQRCFLGSTALASLRVQDRDRARAALEVVNGNFETSTFKDLGRLGFERTRDL